MIKYNFIVDKEACFAYWVQSLVNWGWYFEKEQTLYYQGLAEPFSSEEKEVLELLISILNKKGNYFNWLWSRYAGEEIVNEDEFNAWQKIRTTLDNKFEIIWNKEIKSLLEWREILTNFKFPILNDVYIRITNFFDTKIVNKEIDVKLLFQWGEMPAAHVQRNFEKLIILNISNVEQKNIIRVVNVLTHETIHKIEHFSDITRSMITKAAEKIIESDKSEIKIKGKTQNEQWTYLLTETVISSMASRRFNTYIGRILTNDNSIIEADKILDFDFKRQKIYTGFLIRFVASRIEYLTKQYLDQNRKIDQEYCDKIANEWINIQS